MSRSSVINEIVAEAELDFWMAVARMVPEASTGDMPPDMATTFTAACRSAVEVWLNENLDPPRPPGFGVRNGYAHGSVLSVERDGSQPKDVSITILWDAEVTDRTIIDTRIGFEWPVSFDVAARLRPGVRIRKRVEFDGTGGGTIELDPPPSRFELPIGRR